MKATLISYSGRLTDGSCVGLLKLMEQQLNLLSIETEMLKMGEYQIKPCGQCTYNCFRKEDTCPLEDDVALIYKKMVESTHMIVAIPVYSSAPPALYFALRERSQSIFRDADLYEQYRQVKKAFIVIGNQQAGAEMTIQNILAEEDQLSREDILLIESSEYGQRSTQGELAQNEAVQRKTLSFLEGFLNRA